MAQAAAAAGGEVIVAVRSDDRRPAVAGLATAGVVLTEALDGLEVDVVLDPVGGPARAAAFAALRPFGRHVVVGNAGGDDRPFSGEVAVLGLAAAAEAHRRLGERPAPNKLVLDVSRSDGGATASPARGDPGRRREAAEPERDRAR